MIDLEPLDCLVLPVVALARGPEDALELQARQRIFDKVRERPGIHFSEIVRELDYAPTTVRYHLSVLEREGVLSSLEVGRYLRYYPREQGERFLRDVLSPEEKRALAMLRQRVPLAVAVELLVNGERTHGQLTTAVGVSPSTMTHHLKRMTQVGVVQQAREGREVHVSLVRPEQVRELLKKYEIKPDLADTAVDVFEDVGL
ncbi:MAG TPA: ArsR family transcriptional regulator [Candidatus Thermoplasmatota archaeon]|nr:ArsR family transcriptional regulator [Candidatus Thermoplasmatota archaeon]